MQDISRTQRHVLKGKRGYFANPFTACTHQRTYKADPGISACVRQRKPRKFSNGIDQRNTCAIERRRDMRKCREPRLQLRRRCSALVACARLKLCHQLAVRCEVALAKVSGAARTRCLPATFATWHF